MAGFGNKVKLTILKGMEAVGQSASNLASNAQHKLLELNLETQRREIISDFPLRAYDLWQKGETMPEPLNQMLQELSELDERLGVLRAQRYAHVEGPEGDAGAKDAAEVADPEEEAPCEAAGDAEETESPEGALAEESADSTFSAPISGDAKSGEPADEAAVFTSQTPDAPMDEGETGDNA